MGWGRMFLLGNIGQQLDIEDQRKEIESLKGKLASVGSSEDVDLLQLHRENAELRMYLAALVRYLIVKEIINPKEFRILVDQIDREDGLHDGGFSGDVV